MFRFLPQLGTSMGKTLANALPLLAAILVSAPSAAADKLELARTFLRGQNFAAQMHAMEEACEQANGAGSAYDPARMFRSAPGQFGGVTPQSAYWPEVTAAYRAFVHEVCRMGDPERYLDRLAVVYAERMSEEDLQSLNEFLRSPVGMRFRDVNVIAQGVGARGTYADIRVVRESATARLTKTLGAIVERYRAAPR